MIAIFALVSCGYSAIFEMQSAKWADHPARGCSACSGIKHLPPYFPFHQFLLSKFRQTKFKASDWYVLVTALAHWRLGNSCVPCGLYHWGACLPGLRPNCPPHYWHRQAATSAASCGAAIGKTDVLCRGYILQILHVVVGFVAIFMVDLPRQWVRKTQESNRHQTVHKEVLPLDVDLVISGWAAISRGNSSMQIAAPSMWTDLPAFLNPFALKHCWRKTAVAQGLPGIPGMNKEPPL